MEKYIVIKGETIAYVGETIGANMTYERLLGEYAKDSRPSKMPVLCKIVKKGDDK